MTRHPFRAALMAFALTTAGTAHGADLFRLNGWSSLAADPHAAQVGDSLTVLVYESSKATNSTQNGTRKSGHLGGQLTGGATHTQSGAIDLSNTFDGTGQTGRAQQMLAQISVVVDGLLPNGDLHVSGAQTVKINGERTNIRLQGRVRPLDISGDNTVLSTRLADAAIVYDGAGFAANGAKPGVVGRIFSWLGLP